MKKWGSKVLFLAGFLLCIFPLVSNVITRWQQEEAISTYQTAVEHEKNIDLEKIWEEAGKYNEMLYQFRGEVVDQVNLYEESYYNSQLDCSGTGIMGSLEIPKIDVNLPIYHGTEETSLSNGVGHLKGTSLPVGGKNTHSVLSGHRGLPSSKLLVRLDEIQEGDYFFIRSCNRTLAYKVKEIKVVEPENVSSLDIRNGQDLVSLVTCTPYGINTHRLIVTGERVEYEEGIYESIQPSVPSLRELIFMFLPFILLLFMLGMNYKDRRHLKRGKVKKNSSCSKRSAVDICNISDSTGKYIGHTAGRYKKRIRSDCPDRRKRKYKKRKRRISMC